MTASGSRKPRQPEQVLLGGKEAALSQLRDIQLADDPVGWAKARLAVDLWSKQREIMDALECHDRVAVRSCHDSGKSFVAAVITARWLATHPIGQARVITTAPTNTQVRGILWVEINQLHERSDLPGRVNQTEWWMGSYLAGIGRKPADYRPEAFQGLHARYVLIVIDEASGVTAGLIDAAETLATNVNAKILMIGNPDDPSSMFANIHEDPTKYGYFTIKISAWDTPNFTDEHEGLPALVNESLLSRKWVEGRRLAWGEDHPFWASKVEAEFPSQDSNAIVRVHDLVASRVIEQPFPMQGGESAPPVSTLLPSRLGVDVAGSEHGDETVIRLVSSLSPILASMGAATPGDSPKSVVQAPSRRTPTSAGGLATPPMLMPLTEWRTRSSDPSKVADAILEAIVQSNATQVHVDSIGVGFGIIGIVRERLCALDHTDLWRNRRLVQVIGVNSASRAKDPTLYGNLRAELWWTVGRLMFQKGLIATGYADNLEELEAQLLMPRYKINKGKIWVEAKDDIKARLGRSPDNADAFMYACWSPIGAGIATIGRPPAQTLDPRQVNGHAIAGRLPTLPKIGGSSGSRIGINSANHPAGVGIR